jgi:uncharacterized protein (DUF697 family)
MLTSDYLENYAALLRIRRAAMRRDTIVTGGVFLVSALGAVAFGLLGSLDGRSVYLVSGVVTAIGLGFITAWVRLEITKSLMEFADNLQRAALDGQDKPD